MKGLAIATLACGLALSGCQSYGGGDCCNPCNPCCPTKCAPCPSCKGICSCKSRCAPCNSCKE